MLASAVGMLLSAGDVEAAPADGFEVLVHFGGALGVVANGAAFAMLVIGYRVTGVRALATDAWHAVTDTLGSAIVLVSPLLPRDHAWIAVAAITSLIAGIIAREALEAWPVLGRWLPRTARPDHTA
jgi:divalent metal cation (Fe/Co/Zn/Cd) transporter